MSTAIENPGLARFRVVLVGVVSSKKRRVRILRDRDEEMITAKVVVR